MRHLVPLIVTVFGIGFLSSCSKPAGGNQHATISLRDGSTITGTVLSSSTAEIQVAGDDKINRTIPTAQVRSVQYDDTAQASANGASPAPGAAPAPPPGDAAAPAPPPSNAPPAAAAELPHPDHYHPAESAITTRTYELPAGAQISVRTEETIDSGKAAEGQLFPAEVTRNALDAAGNVVIPRGANAQIVIRSASKGGKIRGASDLVMDLASVSIDGREYQLSTTDLAERGKEGLGANRRTAEYSGGGAAIGAIIGAIAGGGKGAAIGAGSGAGAGALGQILTKGTIKVPVESVLTFQLDRPLRVRAQ